MKSWWTEIDRAVTGALLLARGQTAGLDLFSFTLGGFWRSFLAAILAAPAFGLLLMMPSRLPSGVGEAAPGDVPPIPAVSAPAEFAGFALHWLVLPLAAIALTRFFGLSQRYVPLVVATNWTALVQTVAITILAIVGRGLGEPLALTLALIGLVLALAYEWFTIRTALRTTGVIAAGFVGLDVVLTLLVDALVQRTF